MVYTTYTIKIRTLSIEGFAPESGPVETVVKITGRGLAGTKSVRFGTASAVYTVISDNELVWGFSCQVVVFGFVAGSLFGAGRPFFVPSPTIRFAERAEGVKGPKR